MMTKGGTIWVCVDCMLDHHYPGEQGDDLNTWILWKDEPYQITAGTSCETADHYRTDPDDHTAECETQEFSWNPCGGCGSYLGGTRHAFTWWE